MMMMTKTQNCDCDWPEQRDISRTILFCCAVSGIGQSRDNLDNLPLPLGLMGNIFLLFFKLFFNQSGLLIG